MRYFIITKRDNTSNYEVVNWCDHISYARKKIAEMIDFDLQVFRLTNGYYICTAKAEKEYHSARITDDSKYCMKYCGDRFKPEFAAAIADFIAERERRLQQLEDYNAERQAFPNP